jgi:hypothetical protein
MFCHFSESMWSLELIQSYNKQNKIKYKHELYLLKVDTNFYENFILFENNMLIFVPNSFKMYSKPTKTMPSNCACDKVCQRLATGR